MSRSVDVLSGSVQPLASKNSFWRSFSFWGYLLLWHSGNNSLVYSSVTLFPVICPTTTSQGLSLILLVIWSAFNLCKSLALVWFVLKSRAVVGHTRENKLLHEKIHDLQYIFWGDSLWVLKIKFWCGRYLQNNQLNGSLPTTMSQLTNLQNLYDLNLKIIWFGLACLRV